MPSIKNIWILSFLLLQGFAGMAHGNNKKSPTEQDMVNTIVSCLRTKDPYAYMKLFPQSDSIAFWTLQVADPHTKVYQEMVDQLEHPEIGMHADSLIDVRAKHDFDSLIQVGEKLDIHWNAIIQVRYELIKMKQTRDTVLEKLMPTRFLGVIFIRDMLTRKTYGVSVGDILQIKENWYGGQLKGLYEASTIDDYFAAARKKPKKVKDTVKTTVADEEQQAPKTQKVIVERKLYAGLLDNEIPVQLYIHYLKGNCPEVTCIWEAFYKFGDQDDYIKLNVSKTPEGKWVFSEDPPQGNMELTLDKDKYTGTWLSSDNTTGYDVKLSEIPATPKKIQRMDEVFEKEQWAK